ncbi:serine hydrolase [Mycobacteroides immunogenum]|uniref:serine hydrolase domain-containing protein n=1 Tax=Mycobacteroides immunogenum TaxID=83262 RepID=UPI0025B794CF|nr:serine hydrolase [Mycobacteroides immunogenum]WJR36125.1 serine hydrolase [Mycobacteroides immunogenum]
MHDHNAWNLKPEPVDIDLPDVKDMLTWNRAQRVVGFRNDYRQYSGDTFRPGDHVAPLPVSDRTVDSVSYSMAGITYSLQEYLERSSVTGLLVLKNGQIVHEFYGSGNTSTTLWTSRSVAKSVVSTLVGVALHDGAITSLDDLITQYRPDYSGSAWDGATLRQLITHTTGVQWSEDYTQPDSEFAKMTAYEAGSDTYTHVSDLVRNVKRKPGVAPGEVWDYCTGGAWLLGDILERATGMSLAAYLERKIWKPFGMADTGVWHAYEAGHHDSGGHGFNATLRDWGRFGRFVLQDGVLPSGEKILPDGWVRDAHTWTTAAGSVSPEHPHGAYGYQWWNNSVFAEDVSPKGTPELQSTLWALGIFGQIIAINQTHNLVMVQWSTWDTAAPAFDTQPLEASLIFNAFAAATNTAR